MFDTPTVRFFLAAGALMAVVVVGFWLVQRLRPRPESLASSDAEDADDLLDQLRDALDAGEIDEAEYRRVRETIDRRKP
ncbi:MAG TPA: hypothetical protein VG406_10290 [Isosphaeraceae bacterium]|jgi:uncharacterized membrane protein|nr:hypothetical protein [Isosphaeraceae bacterium]